MTMLFSDAKAGSVTIKPVYRELFADLETPTTAYLKVAQQPSFLLESVEQGERIARYSFIGTGNAAASKLGASRSPSPPANRVLAAAPKIRLKPSPTKTLWLCCGM